MKIKLFSLFHIIIRIYVHILHQQLSILENTISVFFVALAFTIRGAKFGENWIIIIKQDVVNVCIVIVVFRCAIWFFFTLSYFFFSHSHYVFLVFLNEHLNTNLLQSHLTKKRQSPLSFIKNSNIHWNFSLKLCYIYKWLHL